MRVLDIDEFPQSGNYETIGGCRCLHAAQIPKRTDSVKFSGYHKFEVVDIDNYRIDRLLSVTRLDNKATYRHRTARCAGKEDSAARNPFARNINGS